MSILFTDSTVFLAIKILNPKQNSAITILSSLTLKFHAPTELKADLTSLITLTDCKFTFTMFTKKY